MTDTERLARLVRRIGDHVGRLSYHAPANLDADDAWEWASAVVLAALANDLGVGGCFFWRTVDGLAAGSRAIQGGKVWPEDFPLEGVR